MKGPKLVTLIVIGVFFAPLAWGGPGLVNGHHDFTANNTGPHSAYTPGTALDADGNPIANVGLCTYCHTPHKAQSTQLLWNHKLSAQTFSYTDATTTAGTTLPSFVGTWNGASAKCLSCHDGSVAIGDVAVFIEEPHDEASGNSLDPTRMTAIDGGNFVIANSTTGSLDGNHPVAVPYPFGQASSTYNSITTGPSAALTEFVAAPTGVRLYTDNGAGSISSGGTAGQSGIECSSCHDPHDVKSVADLFLLGNLDGSDPSYLCLKCHIK